MAKELLTEEFGAAQGDIVDITSILEPFGVDSQTLADALTAANEVLRKANATSLVTTLGIVEASRDLVAAGCTCLEYRTQCYHIRDCKPGPGGKLQCQLLKHCENKCVRWKCGPV